MCLKGRCLARCAPSCSMLQGSQRGWVQLQVGLLSASLTSVNRNEASRKARPCPQLGKEGSWAQRAKPPHLDTLTCSYFQILRQGGNQILQARLAAFCLTQLNSG